MTMTREQINTFNELLESKEFVGKQMLKYLLWRNTIPQKYRIGQCFEITKSGEWIYGRPVKNIKAQIIKAYSFKEECMWRYELEATIEYQGKSKTTTHFVSEAELNGFKTCDNNINVFDEIKDDALQSMDV